MVVVLLRLVVRVGTAVVLVVVVMVTVVVAIYVCKVTAPASMTQWPWQITTVGMCAPAAGRPSAQPNRSGRHRRIDETELLVHGGCVDAINLHELRPHGLHTTLQSGIGTCL